MTEKYKFTHTLDNSGAEDEYPDNLKITVEFAGEHFSELVNGFKFFAKAVGFADVTIEQYIVDDIHLYYKGGKNGSL